MLMRASIEGSTFVRRTRAGVALAVSLALHCGIAYAVMDAASVYGRSNAPSAKLSVEAVHTIFLDEVLTEKNEPPAESAAAQASVAADTPTPDKHVSETQIEKPEPPAAVEPVRAAALEAPPAPTPPVEVKPADATPEPPVAAPPLPTVDHLAATEMPVAKPDPEAILEEQRREAAERKQKEEEAQARAERERKRETERREEARRIAELEAAKKKLEAEEVERKRKKAEDEAAQKRLAEEQDRKRKAAQQAREAAKAKGAEHDQRASVASRGQAKDARGSARTTASRGEILSYAALVQARVAANKPSGFPSGGRVVLSFGVSGSGGVTFVRISRSSGQSGLDQAALAAVRRAGPFPAPPDQQSHSFSIPFTFN